ncbi:S-phase kinase-associated protein 1-like [Galendromus occidentalis]|uniref:S-phase kinase-associated protein 1-like n=1 Tax=Galendromus occidentalis TaxID=34638 RepID=A0AAJ6W046_9ACAR|nr:S-phase kinase-associated protein 1-like [Galendromus occidentalis]
MSTIKPTSSEGVMSEVEARSTHSSCSLDVMLEFFSVGDDDWTPQSNVKDATLRRVVDWAAHRDENGMDKSTDADRRALTPWEGSFLGAERDFLLEIIEAADGLDIRTLLDQGCEELANKARGKTLGDLRKVFNLPEKKNSE